jgi:hypothetical protein
MLYTKLKRRMFKMICHKEEKLFLNVKKKFILHEKNGHFLCIDPIVGE